MNSKLLLILYVYLCYLIDSCFYNFKFQTRNVTTQLFNQLGFGKSKAWWNNAATETKTKKLHYKVSTIN